MGLLLAIVMGFSSVRLDYRPLIYGALATAGLTLWFGNGQWFWPITIASSYLGGNFPILGGSFTPFQILMAIGIANSLSRK